MSSSEPKTRSPLEETRRLWTGFLVATFISGAIWLLVGWVVLQAFT